MKIKLPVLVLRAKTPRKSCFCEFLGANALKSNVVFEFLVRLIPH